MISKHLELNTENTNIIENNPIVEPEISNSFIGFKNYVGIWPQNSANEMIKYWIIQRSTNLQNCDEKLLETKSYLQISAHYTRKCSIHFFQTDN